MMSKGSFRGTARKCGEVLLEATALLLEGHDAVVFLLLIIFSRSVVVVLELLLVPSAVELSLGRWFLSG